MTTPRGILHPQTNTFSLTTHSPCQALTHLIERYWRVQWSMENAQTHQQATAPHPCVNLSIEGPQAMLVGIFDQRFERTLSGQGDVFGVKFKPGAFYLFHPVNASSLVGKIEPAEHVFADINLLVEQVNHHKQLQDKAIACDVYFSNRVHPTQPEYALVQRALETIITSPTMCTVTQLAQHLHITPRSLQRLFKKWVGVSPKWVICRYRVQGAIDAITDTPPNWTELAIQMGYYDQSHFINDFKSMVGMTPQQYNAQLRAKSVD